MKNIVIIIIAFAASTGCKNTHCPAFPAHFVDYYPYHVGDILRFANSENDTIALKISIVDTSGEESFGFGCDCACEFYHHFTTKGVDTSKFFIEGGIHGSNNYVTGNSRFSDFYNYHDIFYFKKENINPHDPENSNIFGDSIILKNNEADGVNKSLIVKGEGIVEFFDVKNNCIWKKVK